MSGKRAALLVQQADFSFFFDAGGRRRCYIAPERFYEAAGADAAMLASQPLDPAMVEPARQNPCICHSLLYFGMR